MGGWGGGTLAKDDNKGCWKGINVHPRALFLGAHWKFE